MASYFCLESKGAKWRPHEALRAAASAFGLAAALEVEGGGD